VPPLEVQRTIVAILRDELSRLDLTREEIGGQISLLLEHRDALITAAITGFLAVAGRAA